LKLSRTPCNISSDLTQIRQNPNQSNIVHVNIVDQDICRHIIPIPFKELKQLYDPIQARNADNAITNQAAIDLWNQKDIIIRNSSLISIGSSQKKNLYGLPTAREMWVRISTLFAAQAYEIE
jgi:hypothetical protein